MKNKSFVLSMGILFFFVGGVFAWLLFQLFYSNERDFSLRVFPENITVQSGESLQIEVFSGEENVTKQSDFKSSDQNIFFASSSEGIYGKLEGKRPGVGIITIAYNGSELKKEVRVEKIPLSIRCSPVPLEAEIGEEVRWMLFYTETGVAPYTYQWSGDDGFVGNEGLAIKSYQASGEKHAEVRTVDSIGQEAFVKCDSLFVKEREEIKIMQ